MNIAEVFRTSRNTSFSDLVPLSNIRTKKDVSRLTKKGYSFVCTKAELKKVYPSLDIAHLYATPNPLDAPCFYWDKESLIIFAVYLYGTRSMCPGSSDLLKYIQSGVDTFRERVEARDFRFLSTNLNDRMRIEYLTMLIDRDLVSYERFISVYRLSDYGCADIGKERLQKIFSKRTPNDFATTAKSLQSLPSPMEVYRGAGSYSAGLGEAFSWTCRPGAAVFFAIRFGHEDAVIYQGLVNQTDVLEYLDGSEEEIIVMPGGVRNIEEIHLYGLNWLAPILQEISPKYHEYLDSADYEAVPFQISGSVHEKGHSMRVLLLCLIFAHLYSLSDEDMDVLADAALYHDVGRSHEWIEDEHGAASAKLYEEGIDYPQPISSFLMRYHCLPDNEGLESIRTSYASDAEHITFLFNIFKDADGLDRVRLGLMEVDFTQLRTPEAKKLPMVANLLLENVKIPED